MTREEIEVKITELYVGILGRAADYAGLQYWADQIEQGALSLENTRASFATQEQPEYWNIYGGLDNTQLVNAIYSNYLERSPDTEGLEYWVGELDSSNINADQMINAIINAVQDPAATAAQTLVDAQVLLNKIEAAQYFTETTQTVSVTTSGFISRAQGAVADVNDDATTITTSKSATDSYADSIATVSISATDPTATETDSLGGDTSGEFTVTLTKASDTDTVINYSIAGSAEATDDYTALSGSVTILANQLDATIDVSGIVDDLLVESDETVELTLISAEPSSSDIEQDSTPTNLTDTVIALDSTPANLTATVTISDNDTATVSISATDPTATEIDSTSGQFTVTLTKASDTDTVISYSIAGSAEATDDYTALSGSVTILANQLSATIDVSGIVDDSLVESDETVELTLTSIESGSSNIALDSTPANLTDTVTISDNDSATVSISATDPTATETGSTSGQFTISLTKASDTDTVINYSIDGSANPTDDYTALSGSVTILANQLTATIDVSGIVDDTLVEGDETVELTLTSIGSSSSNITLDNTPANLTDTVTISDNDSAAIVGTWQVNNASDPIIFIFNADGSYSMAETGGSSTTDGFMLRTDSDNPTGYMGKETGTYQWDESTGKLSILTVTSDNNGAWGLSDDLGGTLQVNIVNGVMSLPTEELTFSKVASAVDTAIVGIWDLSNPSDPEDDIIFNFNPDGSYSMWEAGASYVDDDDDPTGYSGSESGTYLWDESTGLLSILSIRSDSNGNWGLSDDLGGTLQVSIVGGVMSLPEDGYTFM